MNWRRGFFRLWVFATLFWIVLVAILLRPDALTKFPAAHSHEISKTSDRDDDPSGDSIRSLITDKVVASVLGPVNSERQGNKVVVLLRKGETSRQLRDNLLKFTVVALVPPWAMLLLGFSVIWVIRGFERK